MSRFDVFRYHGEIAEFIEAKSSVVHGENTLGMSAALLDAASRYDWIGPKTDTVALLAAKLLADETTDEMLYRLRAAGGNPSRHGRYDQIDPPPVAPKIVSVSGRITAASSMRGELTVKPPPKKRKPRGIKANPKSAVIRAFYAHYLTQCTGPYAMTANEYARRFCGIEKNGRIRLNLWFNEIEHPEEYREHIRLCTGVDVGINPKRATAALDLSRKNRP